MRETITRLRALACFLVLLAPALAHAQMRPMVAIHDSELTRALETMPAAATTPRGAGTTGFEWWPATFRYFVMPESVKEALRSDGTAFAVVSDANIAAGALLDANGKPVYPIVISLASEAIGDQQINQLRAYVAAGGTLMAGSSAFTRFPDGRTRGDFALAPEMGVHMFTPGLTNWVTATTLSKSSNHDIVSEIPAGIISWHMPSSAEEISWGTSPHQNFLATGQPHPLWRVTPAGAQVIAVGDPAGSQYPYLLVKEYGAGEFVYHAGMQPLVGHGGWAPGMHAYSIFKNTIERAFARNSVPIPRVSPWRFQYDAAMIVRHDFEENEGLILSIEESAQSEKALGAKGDYYFATGALREGANWYSDRQQAIDSLRRAVGLHGATIGPHNGGLPNPGNPNLTPFDFDYWHWSTDEVLDLTVSGYANGKAFAKASMLASFNDLSGWLSGLGTGRRTWVAPYYNATREASYEIQQELNVITAGEQKLSPFPHWTLSTRVPNKRFPTLSLPVSDWFTGPQVAHSMDWGWTIADVHAAVDRYYELGALVNLYSHAPTLQNYSPAGDLQYEYVRYAVTKPRMWSTNAEGIYDWWVRRQNVQITPAFSTSGNQYVLTYQISGLVDADTSVEAYVPGGEAGFGSFQVLRNGVVAPSSMYRVNGSLVKVRVGPGITSVQIRYSLRPLAKSDFFSGLVSTPLTVQAPGVLVNDAVSGSGTLTASVSTQPVHGTAQLSSNGGLVFTPASGFIGTDSFTYIANDGTMNSFPGTVTVSIGPAGSLLFDDFIRPPGADASAPWSPVFGAWTITNGVIQGASPSMYAYAYAYSGNAQWEDYSVEARVRFPAGGYGGGLGGRLNPTRGAHYAAWLYPGAAGQNATLQLVKFTSWTTWVAMQWVSVPDIGTGWHTMKLTFQGNRVGVVFDGTQMMDVVDTGIGGTAAYLTGAVSLDMWRHVAATTIEFDDFIVRQSAAAKPDDYNTTANTMLNVPLPGVLANDVLGGGSLPVVVATPPARGSVNLSPNGAFTYTPSTGFIGLDSFTYKIDDGTPSSTIGRVAVTVKPMTGTLLFHDFTAAPAPQWLVAGGTWSVADGVLSGTGGQSQYAYAYNPASWTDYSVEAWVRFPAGGYGAGLGGRLDTATGAHYGAWIYPETTPGGAATLRLVKFRNWTSWSGTPMQQVALPAVSSGWHALKLVFRENRIQVLVDGTLLIDVADSGFDSRPAYLTGGITVDMWNGNPFTFVVDDVLVRAAIAQSDSYVTNYATTLNVPAPGVKANDNVPTNGSWVATVVTPPTGGSLSLNSSGAFVYTPNAGFFGVDTFQYRISDGVTASDPATVSITVGQPPPVFSDNFSRSTDPGPLAPWAAAMGTWTVTGGALNGSSASGQYGYAYMPGTWTNYSVEGKVQFPSGGYGGGLGGRLNTATGAHYGAWLYPESSPGGSATLLLIKFSSWTSWTTMQQVNLPALGSGAHSLKLSFSNNRIQVSFDGSLVADQTDTQAPLTSGGITVDMWSSSPYVLRVDDIVVH